MQTMENTIHPYTEVIAEETTTLRDIITKIPSKSKYFAILVDGQKAELNSTVEKGQKVIILPMIAGGSVKRSETILDQLKSAQEEIVCPNCNKILDKDNDITTELVKGVEWYWCRFCEEPLELECPHNNVSVWMTVVEKRSYENKDGEYQLVHSKVKEADWSTASFHCDDCDGSLSKEEFDKKYYAKLNEED